MENNFAGKLTALRREKKCSQKDAAEALGISQALLSHYEKGIRECKTDFVVKAARFYGVTTDYLLGVSETRQGLNEIFSPETQQEDHQQKLRTVFRSMVMTAEMMSRCGGNCPDLYLDYFSVSVYNFLTILAKRSVIPADWFKLDINMGNLVTRALMEYLSDSDIGEPAAVPGSEPPVCIATVLDACEKLINGHLRSVSGNFTTGQQ